MHHPFRQSAVVILALLVTALAFRAFLPTYTPPFPKVGWKSLQSSIAINERWSLNDVEQAVVIRGRDTNNPVLVWVGDLWCETPVLRHFNAGLENHFIVVYWCQRYSGQSFDPFAPRPSRLSVDDYVSDLDALVKRVGERMHTDKVIIAGHSSGTIVGLRYALVHPERVAAYVGIGQVIDQAESLRRAYDFALHEASATHNGQATAELQRIGPPPYRQNEGTILRKWVIEFGGAFHNGLSYAELAGISMQAPEANWRDISAFLWGEKHTDSVAREMAAYRFDGRSLTFQVPIYLLSGKYDHRTDSALASEFIEQISAPKKAFVQFDSSAHSPPFEEPSAFENWMVGNLHSGQR